MLAISQTIMLIIHFWKLQFWSGERSKLNTAYKGYVMTLKCHQHLRDISKTTEEPIFFIKHKITTKTLEAPSLSSRLSKTWSYCSLLKRSLERPTPIHCTHVRKWEITVTPAQGRQSPGQWSVCAQTTALGVPHEWISHSAWLPAPQKDGCWLSHLGFHVLKSTGSPLTGTNQNFFAPKKCVISFLTKEWVFETNSEQGAGFEYTGVS